MHFLSDTEPITLHTDASDYCVGGFLFQTVDGKDQPRSPNSVGQKPMEYSTPECTYSLFYVIVFLLYEQIIEIYYLFLLS